MIRVIINADDFGMNPNVTKAIEDAFVGGYITSSTLMINMPCSEEAIQWAYDNGFDRDLGLHVCLTEGMPLTDGIRHSRLFCDDNGLFNGVFHWNSRIKHFFLPNSERDLLAREIDAQIKKYLSYHLPLHFDSHHHVHTDWVVAKTVLPMAKMYGFKSTRIGVNIAHFRTGISKIYKAFLSNYISSKEIFHTEFMGGFRDVVTNFGNITDGSTVEIMVHPMYMKDGQFDMNGEYVDSGLQGMGEVIKFRKNIAIKRNINFVSFANCFDSRSSTEE